MLEISVVPSSFAVRFFLIFRCHFSHFTSTKHLLPILIGTVARTLLVLFISSQALIFQYTLVTAWFLFNISAAIATTDVFQYFPSVFLDETENSHSHIYFALFFISWFLFPSIFFPFHSLFLATPWRK